MVLSNVKLCGGGGEHRGLLYREYSFGLKARIGKKVLARRNGSKMCKVGSGCDGVQRRDRARGEAGLSEQKRVGTCPTPLEKERAPGNEGDGGKEESEVERGQEKH